MQSIIATQSAFSKLRPNLWQARDGSVIGFGAILAPGGLYYCFTCSADGCQHTASVDEAWLSGRDSAEIPFDGMIDEALDYNEDDELTFVSGAGMFTEADYGLESWL